MGVLGSLVRSNYAGTSTATRTSLGDAAPTAVKVSQIVMMADRLDTFTKEKRRAKGAEGLEEMEEGRWVRMLWCSGRGNGDGGTTRGKEGGRGEEWGLGDAQLCHQEPPPCTTSHAHPPPPRILRTRAHHTIDITMHIAASSPFSWSSSACADPGP